MIASLKDFVSHLASTGTRTTSEKNAMHTILSACKRIPVTEQNRVRMLLGIPKQTWYEHTPLPNEERYKHKLRKERNVSEIVRNQHRSIKDFCHSEEALHLDSNSRRIVVVLNENGEEEKHVGRVW